MQHGNLFQGHSPVCRENLVTAHAKLPAEQGVHRRRAHAETAAQMSEINRRVEIDLSGLDHLGKQGILVI